MKILKNIIGIFILASMFYACQDEAYAPKSEFADAGFYTSYGPQVARSATVGNYEAFMDLSQGAIYHYWAVDSGNFFLDGKDIPRSERNYDKYIINPGDTSSTDINVNVLFMRGDTAFKVRLFNVFEDSVTWKGIDEELGWDSELGAFVPKDHGAVYQESGEWAGKWVFQYDILVDVYDTIVTDMVLRKEGTVIPHDVAGDTLKIHVGDILQFEDLSEFVDNTARPDATVWQIKDSTDVASENHNYTSSNKKLADIPFLKRGVFHAILISKREATEDVPGDTEEYHMPLVIEVLQAEGPFLQQGAIKQPTDNITINVPFNALVAEGLTEQTAGLFTVKVEGMADPIAVTKVERVENNQNRVNLTLASELYPGDVATLSYTMNEEYGVFSQDDRPLEAFTDVTISLYDPNLLDLVAAGFEDKLGDIWNVVASFNGEVSYATQPEPVATGKQSLKMYCPPNGDAVNHRPKVQQEGALFNLVGGTTYTVKYKRYMEIDPANEAKAKGDKIFVGGKQVNTGGQSNFTIFGEWEEIEIDYTPAADQAGAFFAIQLIPQREAGIERTVYYDDIYIAEKVVRP